MSIGLIILGLVLVAAGALMATMLRNKLSSKAVDVQYMRSTSIKDLKQSMGEMSGMGGTPRQYVELQGVADARTPPQTPYTEKEVAYYESSLIQVYEAEETYKDDEGRQQKRTVRREETITNEKSYEQLLLKDAATGESVTIDLMAGGMQLDLVDGCDRFEPTANMGAFRFFGAFTPRALGNRTLGYRMVERIIPLGHPLFVLGEAYARAGEICVGKPNEGKKSFIVSTKSEGQIVGEAKRGATFALVGGIVLAVAGLALTVYGFFAG